jgi:hypothetical protein
MSDIARDLRKLEQEAANAASEDIDYGTIEHPTFRVFRADGTEVMIGDTLINSLGEDTTFRGCKHPRKVMTSEMGCERYPSVYQLEIRGPEGYVWNVVSDAGRKIQASGE